MRVFIGFTALLAALAWETVTTNAAEDSSKAAAQPDAGGFVLVCPIDREIDDGLAVMVKRAIERNSPGAAAVVLVIDTFGGRVDSAIDITESVGRAGCPTIAYIKGRGAISAGALISYSCQKIVMAPGTNIGASTPYMPAADVAAQVSEKSMSFLRARYRTLGELNGHNPLLGEAMVDPSVELYGWPKPAGGWVIVKSGETLSAAETKPLPGTPQHPVDTIFNALGAGSDPSVAPVREAVKQIVGNAGIVAAPPAVPGRPSDSPVKELPSNATLVSAAGKLLTLTTGEALLYGLAEAQAATLDDALANAGLAQLRRVNVQMRWDEALFAFLTMPLISGLLLMCGVGCIYLEMKAPGMGWAAALGAACLALFFGARLVVGMADWIDIALVFAGLGLVAAEIFVFPTLGALGGTGILCLLAGFYLSLTRVVVPTYDWDFTRLHDATLTLIIATGAFCVFAALTWKLFPRSPLGRALILSSTQQASEGYTVQTAEDRALAVGRRGLSASMLRPAGRGRFDGVTYDVVTQGEFIEPDRPIEIIEAEGNRYVVRETGD
jgi:membrane-bound serine protease (ClpP class)